MASFDQLWPVLISYVTNFNWSQLQLVSDWSWLVNHEQPPLTAATNTDNGQVLLVINKEGVCYASLHLRRLRLVVLRLAGRFLELAVLGEALTSLVSDSWHSIRLGSTSGKLSRDLRLLCKVYSQVIISWGSPYYMSELIYTSEQ